MLFKSMNIYNIKNQINSILSVRAHFYSFVFIKIYIVEVKKEEYFFLEAAVEGHLEVKNILYFRIWKILIDYH